MTTHRGLFGPGQTVITPGALEALLETQHHPGEYLQRHLSGDWGDLCIEDQQENQLSLQQGLRLMSAYVISSTQKIWIITEADRSATTVLLPEEY